MYELEITDSDVRTIEFVASRYAWADALIAYAFADTHHLDEYEAWMIAEAIDADCEGGHSPLPMLDPQSDLYAKLMHLRGSIV